MSAAYVNGSWRCYELINGRYRHFLGCQHDRPRAAIRHSTNLEPFTSPLRTSDGASTPVPNPLSGPGLSDAPSEPRLGHTDPLRP